MTTMLCDPNSLNRIDLQKVNILTLRRQSHWTTDPEKQILTSLRCLSKGAGKERIRAEMQQLIEDERLNEHEHIYTDRSLKEEQVGCALVMLFYTFKYRLLPQTKIFNAEMFAILKAMEQPNETNYSRIIMSYDRLLKQPDSIRKSFAQQELNGKLNFEQLRKVKV
jgi:hypothetical protein